MYVVLLLAFVWGPKWLVVSAAILGVAAIGLMALGREPNPEQVPAEAVLVGEEI